jgi:alpha-L-rhamnosidase
MLAEIGKHDEAARCREYAEGAKKAYQCNFVKDKDIESVRQAKLVRPLALGLLDAETEKNVAARLNETAKSRDYKIGTGFLSTPFILPVLADHGYVETAYRMLENEEEPGWLAMVRQGATTVWEHYNGYDKEGHPLDTSYNHYSPGAVVSFLFEYTAGIRLVGERKFLFKPVVGGTLDHARAKWDSPYGTVRAEWKKEGTKVTYRVEVPANCEAEVELPGGRKVQVEEGKKEVEIL